MNETQIAQDFIKEQTSSALKNIVPILKEQLTPLKGIIEIIFIILIVYIIFKIIKEFIELSDHRRLVRLENKMDFLLEKIERKNKTSLKKKT
ncbi:MAG: hypothetical protein AABX66_03975 [Nanoarchaeota archaeon]